ALPADDRKVVSAVFFVEQGAATLDSRPVDPDALASALAAGTYLSAGLRVPHRPEGSEQAVEVGVRVTDSAGQTTKALVDLEILDDREAPSLNLAEPAAATSLEANALLAISGRIDDNFYAEDPTVVLIDANGETIVPFSDFSRNDHVESLSVPNPSSFGGVIVGQRFFSDFKGRIKLPASFADRVGQTVQLQLRTRDYGYNSAESGKVAITVRGDETGPSIRVNGPPARVFEQQAVVAKISITDGSGVASYAVSIVGEPSPRRQGSGLTATTVNTEFPVDISGLDPDDPAHNYFTLLVDATDRRGNSSRETQVVRVTRDEAPLVTMLDAQPASKLIRGGIAYQTIAVDDDYASGSEPVRLLTVHSSLSGARAARGEPLPDPLDAQVVLPTVSLSYSEAAAMPGTLSLSGRPYLQASGDGAMRVWPLGSSTTGNLRLDYGADYSVRYHVQVFHGCGTGTCGCFGFTEESTIEGGAGVSIASLLADSVEYAVITPEVLGAGGQIVDGFVQQIRFDANSISALRSYAVGATQRTLVGGYTVGVLVRDAVAPSRVALVAGERVNAFGNASNQMRVSSRLPIPAAGELSALSLYAYAVDRLTAQRGGIALQPLTLRSVEGDASAPALTVVSPANGSNVVPGQRLAFDVSVLDNSQGFSTLKVYDENSELVQQLTGRYAVSRYQLPYEVAKDARAGQVKLLFVAEDYSGVTSSYQLTLPIAENLPPQMTYTRFAGESTVVSAVALNRGQFTVRQNASFQIDLTLADDAGLDRFDLYKVDALGQPVTTLLSRVFTTTCPSAPTLSSKVSATVLFDEGRPVQYLAVVRDSLGHEVRRTFLVEPLSNMAPEIRIVSPAQGQAIAAGTFVIEVDVIATDDRPLSSSSVEIYASGVRLLGTLLPSFDVESSTVDLAFASIRGTLQQKYGQELATLHGRSTSPNAQKLGLLMEVPSGLIGQNETVTLTAVVRDADNAVGRHELSFLVAPDVINPELLITKPQVGFGVHENSDFTVGFRAYDNVKVEQLELYASYGGRPAGGAYRLMPYGAPLRVIKGLESRDFQPISTLNIDTPE
ncbi:MAG TPA: hypothetical protein VK509_24365, partial [Polyangiales bacterium]|nr:hypothetical protein [Polyangiales bacterium]